MLGVLFSGHPILEGKSVSPALTMRRAETVSKMMSGKGRICVGIALEFQSAFPCAILNLLLLSCFWGVKGIKPSWVEVDFHGSISTLNGYNSSFRFKQCGD